MVVRVGFSTGAFLEDFCLRRLPREFCGVCVGHRAGSVVGEVWVRDAAGGNRRGLDKRPWPAPRGQHTELRCSEGRWSTIQVTNWPERNGSFHPHQNLYVRLIGVSFIIIKNWKQLSCPSTGGWTNKQ